MPNLWLCSPTHLHISSWFFCPSCLLRANLSLNFYLPYSTTFSDHLICVSCPTSPLACLFIESSSHLEPVASNLQRKMWELELFELEPLEQAAISSIQRPSSLILSLSIESSSLILSLSKRWEGPYSSSLILSLSSARYLYVSSSNRCQCVFEACPARHP